RVVSALISGAGLVRSSRPWASLISHCPCCRSYCTHTGLPAGTTPTYRLRVYTDTLPRRSPCRRPAQPARWPAPPPPAPLLRLPGRGVRATAVRQAGEHLPAAAPGRQRVTLPLQGVVLVQPALQLSHAGARVRLGPAFARALRAFDDAVLLRAARV